MIIESVPNFSEGRRPEVGESLKSAAAAVPGVKVLGFESDRDHNRSVLTFVGERGPVAEAAFACARRAAEAIDLRTHQGQHPRMGATDVLPFVPIREASLEDCVSLAREVGRRIGEELRIPVFLYEAAATRPERRNLAEIRRPQFEGLRDLIGKDPDRAPDFGPPSIHPSAGCTAVGARPPLIAYNVDLEGGDAALAKKIAKRIRERDGGLPGIKALGLHVADRNCAQVSINVCDYERTSLKAVFDAVAAQAAAAGVKVRSSEIVGLCPRASLPEPWIPHLKLSGFRPEQIIENQLGL